MWQCCFLLVGLPHKVCHQQNQGVQSKTACLQRHAFGLQQNATNIILPTPQKKHHCCKVIESTVSRLQVIFVSHPHSRKCLKLKNPSAQSWSKLATVDSSTFPGWGFGKGWSHPNRSAPTANRVVRAAATAWNYEQKHTPWGCPRNTCDIVYHKIWRSNCCNSNILEQINLIHIIHIVYIQYVICILDHNIQWQHWKEHGTFFRMIWIWCSWFPSQSRLLHAFKAYVQYQSISAQRVLKSCGVNPKWIVWTGKSLPQDIYSSNNWVFSKALKTRSICHIRSSIP